jgi:GT2 family glycosyltransferase
MMGEKEIDISIVIVNYKTPKLTDTCLASIYRFTKDIKFEIVLVDNDSQDESESLIMSKYPEVVWINSGSNAGTSVAYNIGVKASKGKYVLIMNSDTEFKDNAVKISLDEYKRIEESQKIGMLGCQLIGYDDIIQFNSNLSFPSIREYLRGNPFFIKFNILQKKMSDQERHLQHLEDHESVWLGIVFGIINNDIFKKQTLYFDEDIFMYSDEVEWCFRLMKKGYKHYFTTKTTILHWNGGSSTSFSEWRHGQIVISSWLNLIKTRGKVYFILCMLLQIINLGLDQLFYSKSKLFGTLSEEEKQQHNVRKLDWKIFKRYFGKLLFKYKSKTSSNGEFLKYEIK